MRPYASPRVYPLSHPPRAVAVVQARLGSVRMPRKVLSPVLGQPLLLHLIERLRRCSSLDDVALAIPDTTENDALATFAAQHGIACSRGSEHDVLARFHAAAEAAEAGVVVRITGDCPIVDPSLVDRLVSALIHDGLDWIATGSTFPDGLDIEVCTMASLSQAMVAATDPYDREHVMPYVRRCSTRSAVIEHTQDLGRVRLTLDEPGDLSVIRGVFDHFGNNVFGLDDVERLLASHPELFQANQGAQRNEGAMMNTGEKLWKRARNVIAGGNMLLSKRADMHLPVGWPAYFSKSKGCKVWDLDGNELLDFGFMGIGTNILGYAHPEVDDAVRAVVDKGNLTTLNCPEEVFLAERLVELHPWADMARFTRSGGEACAVAVRIARAASGRDGVAICGYHGWHDWYLAANLADDEALDGHLLPGLQPKGVARGLRGTVRPFRYNDLTSLETELAKGDIGTIFMEVERSTPPDPGFLEGVRRLVTSHGAVLVFDECTSGFRKVLGGLHLHHGVEPDIVVLGKTLGNGYAINAVVGREEVMQATQSTFVSSTFWTERIGPSAALAALDVMAKEDAPARIDALGRAVREKLSALADDLGVSLVHSGLPALTSYTLHGFDPAVVKTYVTQEMLKRGILASSVLYVALPHEDHVLRYIEELGSVWQHLVDAHASGLIDTLLPNGTATTGFARLA